MTRVINGTFLEFLLETDKTLPVCSVLVVEHVTILVYTMGPRIPRVIII